MTHTVLFELGCEELPPKSLKTLRDEVLAQLKAQVEAEAAQNKANA